MASFHKGATFEVYVKGDSVFILKAGVNAKDEIFFEDACEIVVADAAEPTKTTVGGASYDAATQKTLDPAKLFDALHWLAAGLIAENKG